MMLAFAGEGGGILDQLGINLKVVAVQVVIFLITIWVLYRFLFRPVTEFTERRDKEMDEAVAGIEKNRAEVERLAAEYRKKLDEIEKRAYDRLQEAIKEGLKAKAEIVAKAEKETRSLVEKARAEIEKEKAAAREALRAEVKRLALDAAERLTGRAPDPKQSERILDEILTKETR